MSAKLLAIRDGIEKGDRGQVLDDLNLGGDLGNAYVFYSARLPSWP
ncbi:hypothetical protein N836_17705 [Leptolyngbya sp. Heron Island J]|nr:hypothetical protein [Leptolyngbya sp. Heron Island J]ESA34253.1 hypothetical protein N836_17705 [Leptolyngbya sp. Heron Island J]